MRAWKAVVLLNLALVVGVGWGYTFWGLRAARLERELAVARAAATALAGVEREWTVEGVVRAIFPEINVLVITHGDIAGSMPPMTMGFRVASPKIQEAVSVGDAVRFTIRGIPPNVAVTAIQRIDAK